MTTGLPPLGSATPFARRRENDIATKGYLFSKYNRLVDHVDNLCDHLDQFCNRVRILEAGVRFLAAHVDLPPPDNAEAEVPV